MGCAGGMNTAPPTHVQRPLVELVSLPKPGSPTPRSAAQAEDRSVSSIVRAALKAYLEGGRKARYHHEWVVGAPLHQGPQRVLARRTFGRLQQIWRSIGTCDKTARAMSDQIPEIPEPPPPEPEKRGFLSRATQAAKGVSRRHGKRAQNIPPRRRPMLTRKPLRLLRYVGPSRT